MAIYNGKHVVFEQVDVDWTTYDWNSQTHLDNEDYSNNYSESYIRTTLNQTIIAYLSSELSSQLVSTTVQTAKNGKSYTSNALISTTDKLFLPASKEVGYTAYSVSAENDALTTWQYWTSHTSQPNHQKYATGTSTSKNWWNRSPYTNNRHGVCIIQSAGNSFYVTGDTYNNISSCFAW